MKIFEIKIKIFNIHLVLIQVKLSKKINLNIEFNI